MNISQTKKARGFWDIVMCAPNEDTDATETVQNGTLAIQAAGSVPILLECISESEQSSSTPPMNLSTSVSSSSSGASVPDARSLPVTSPPCAIPSLLNIDNCFPAVASSHAICIPFKTSESSSRESCTSEKRNSSTRGSAIPGIAGPIWNYTGSAEVSKPRIACWHGHCDKKFKRKWDLQKHIEAVHYRFKPFTCSVCPKKFGHKGTRDKHVRTIHLRIRPFNCQHAGCGRTFSERGNMRKHMESKHSN